MCWLVRALPIRSRFGGAIFPDCIASMNSSSRLAYSPRTADPGRLLIDFEDRTPRLLWELLSILSVVLAPLSVFADFFSYKPAWPLEVVYFWPFFVFCFWILGSVLTSGIALTSLLSFVLSPWIKLLCDKFREMRLPYSIQAFKIMR